MNDVKDILVTKCSSLREALSILNETAMSILLVVDNSGRLIRTVTDGDIRRLLLNGCDLTDELSRLDDQEPLTLNESATRVNALAIMNEFDVQQVPVVDDSHKPVGLYRFQDVQSRIQLSIPHMGDYERQYVEEAFQTNWIAPLGPNVDAFEKEISAYVGIGHAAALSSGTAAIHLALRLLNVERDDVVLCSSFTFVASANPILYQGAIPVFIDSEPATWNMSPVALERALAEYTKKGQKPKAIVVVHLFGQSADMEKIMALSEKYDVPVVEDAAESLGATYRGKQTGTFGKFGIFSFNGNKIITTSGGGMLISDDGDLIERARFLSTQARDPSPYYEHSEVGYNYRMSNVLAGIGRGQLKVLDERVTSRRGVFFRYEDAFSEVECIELMPEPEGYFSNRWLSAISINPNKTGIKPSDLIEKLSKSNIEARPVWKPMHLQPLFSGASYYTHAEGASFCDYLFDTSICLPSASNMTFEQQSSVINCVLELLSRS